MSGFRAAVVTVSNSVAAGSSDDRSGTILEERLTDLGFDVVERVVIPDGVTSVEMALSGLVPDHDLIITTGGTGLSPTDLTPEGTLRVIDRMVPGIAEAMRSATFGRIPFGMLSRGVSGVAGSCLIINLPGSPKAVAEGLEVIGETLEHAVALATENFGRHD